MPPKMYDEDDGLNIGTLKQSIISVDDDYSCDSSMGQEDEPCEQKLAAKESRRVRRTKCFVIFFLLIIMIGLSISAYILEFNKEDEEFRRQFDDHSRNVLSCIGSKLVRILQASDAFVVSVTSLASATNQDWPFVVVPDFAVRAEKIRSLANAVYVTNYNLVQPNRRKEWESFTAQYGDSMVRESIKAIEEYEAMDWPVVWDYELWDVIHDYDEFEKENPGQNGVDTKGPWLPMWQIQPTISYEPPYNWDLMTVPLSTTMNVTSSQKILDTRKVLITEAYLISYPDDREHLEFDKEEAEWISTYLVDDEEPMEPISDIYYPILMEANRLIEINSDHNIFSRPHEVAGIFSLAIYWREYIKNVLRTGSNGVIVVFESQCNPTFTYQINGPDVVFLGAGDFHDSKYDDMAITKSISELSKSAMEEDSYSGIQLDDEFCPFQITVYPSDTFRNFYMPKTPAAFAVVMVIIFAVTALTFIIYDFWVQRRQKVILKTAMTTKKLVSSLFPEVVIDQIMPSLDEASVSGNNQPKKLQYFLNQGNDNLWSESELGFTHQSKPIAELFPDTTVFFADIAGFTAWSSAREPSHVFVLLETLYGSFDKIAKQYRIFKVETIGDSYVAVCGLPEPRKHHAVAMARFAFACLEKMKEKTRKMELTLGPGTADLGLRIGLHSGPTIAGVLRGEKARFQLFGDTVNTTSRMESTGESNRIQVSQKTAKLLIAAVKESRLIKREELVIAKGKGQLQTYWLERDRNRSASTYTDMTFEAFSLPSFRSENKTPKMQRLIDWNVLIFEALLKEIVAHRNYSPKEIPKTQGLTIREEIIARPRFTLKGSLDTKTIEFVTNKDGHFRDEVVEAISMPTYTSTAVPPNTNPEIDPEVLEQLRDYITRIANYYNADNDFHNFEHASHVIMSTAKLLQRIASPDVKKKDCETKQDFFNYTFGISSDPLTKFAIVFSALVHDVDHQGVPNGQLSKEQNPLAEVYDNKSILEQHSLNLAWTFLEEARFVELRKCIFPTQNEYNRFRQISVNCVIATDIFDKEMKSFRDSRWEKAFKSRRPSQLGKTQTDDWNRKATIIIECIIQASDVSHTMQHWHVYQKWNKCLFNEQYKAYENGRSDRHPAAFWYESELWFFDNYVIPLATKLRECEVFGVSCDEFLNFANENRKEWEVKGHGIVAQMLKDAKDRIEE